MLQVKEISKQFRTGELVQQALNGVTLNLRDNEFVSILGPSGSGKTTLLNIIGGLDRYDSGDLFINGVSTKNYKDRDWDAYRNHTIGFVFQSYNLIPHQSILANVELALTIGGISRSQRRSRAKKALEEVGLGDQLHKRPNQLSGGQMQRVAIARALVNDPDILLADEPTGALDTETSLQVMELLKRVAKEKLVVMVTHNPELAQQYSTRIVKLRDGKIIDDSDPFTPETEPQPVQRTLGKAKMSFRTSLSLSFNNLRTKKGRTLLTAFAGSIGIIGIALILALSSGVNTYIADIQRETMTSYPITITAQAMDLSSLMGMNGMSMGQREEEEPEERDGVFADYRVIQSSEAFISSIKENNLTAFKTYLDDPDSEIRQYLGENGVIYSYAVSFRAYSYDKNGDLVASDANTEDVGGSRLSRAAASGAGNPMAGMNRMTAMMSGTSAAENFGEMIPGPDGETVSPILTDSYDLLYGHWPQSYDEGVLVLDRRNSISAEALYQLGLLTGEEYQEITETIQAGEEARVYSWDYEAVCGHTFYILPACEHYVEREDGTFAYVGEDAFQLEGQLEQGIEFRLSGVIRPKKDAANASLTAAVAYPSSLTDHIIQQTDRSAVVTAQERQDTVNILNGMEFEALDDSARVEAAKEYLMGLGISDKASFYTIVMYYSAQNGQAGAAQAPAAAPESGASGTGMTGSGIPEGTMPEGVMPEGGMSESAMLQGGMPGGELPQGSMSMTAQPDETMMAAGLDRWLETSPDETFLLMVYQEYIAGASYEDNMKSFGKVSYDAPASISIYTDRFEDKDAIAECIQHYNDGVEEQNQITYTDYVALLTSSITTIVDVISYVLIAFVAVSLVVSSIMIGIITHISVMERTKEIGILRAMGASKRNVSQVFNAETVIIGLFAGGLGVGVTALLTIPINSLLQSLLEQDNLAAALPLPAALLLMVLSVIITVIAGLIPARSAAKKDPVAALRTE